MSTISKDIKKQIIRYVIYLFFVLGLTALAFYLSIGNNVTRVLDTLKSANAWYIVAIFGVVVGCILARSIVIYFLTRIFEKKYLFHRAIAIDQIGSLYRMVTPAGIGGHVMETYTYNKQGIKISSALSIIAMYSIVYQVVLILYGIISIIVKSNVINDIGHIYISFGNNGVSISLWVLISIGFAFNVFSIGFILLISYWNGFFRFIRGPIVSLLVKIHLLKNKEKNQAKLDEAVINFRNNLKTLFKHVPTLLIGVLFFFIYITISYSVPYICGLSLGNASIYANYWDSVLLSNIHQMVTCVIPIPGSSLISEMFFLQLFYPGSGPSFYESESIARASLLLWRSLMFVIPLFIASIYTIVYRPRKKKIDENHKDQTIKE